jgi:hypothetical protein
VPTYAMIKTIALHVVRLFRLRRKSYDDEKTIKD